MYLLTREVHILFTIRRSENKMTLLIGDFIAIIFIINNNRMKFFCITLLQRNKDERKGRQTSWQRKNSNRKLSDNL